MARDVMILMRVNPFWGPLEGVGPENQDIFWGWNGSEWSELLFGSQKVKLRFSGLTPSNGPSNGFASITIIKSKRHIKKQVYR